MTTPAFLPLSCADEGADPIEGRIAFDLATQHDGSLMYLPAGEHTVVATQGKKIVHKTVLVEPAAVQACNAQLAHIVAMGKSPMMDFNHADDNASFRPSGFEWREQPAPGVYALGEWTGRGREAVRGKEYSHFSPRVHFEEGVTPARVICRTTDPKPNMGGLVNDPAFHKISPVRAKDSSGAAGETQTKNAKSDQMNEQELAALRAKNQELETELTALRAKAAADANNTALALELKAAEAELKASRHEERAAALEAKNKALEASDQTRRESDADKAVADAVTRGAILAKDETTQTAWKKLIVADPANAALLAKQAGSVALAPQRVTSSTKVEGGREILVGRMASKDALQAYSAVVAKQGKLEKHQMSERAVLAKEAAAIFAVELKGREDEWQHVPVQALLAADVTSASIGTLAGTLVLQRSLPLLKFNYPMLQTMFNDFSDAPGLFNQTETTRIPITPAVTTYDPSLDSNGRPKGFVVVTPAQSVDVSITLDEHVGVPMIFGVQTLASTVRNLFAEQSAGALNALGGYFVNKATALMTAGNFNAYAQITDASCGTTSGSTAITLASTAGVYPGQEISGTGIPAGAHIASVPSSGNAVLTIAATATGTVTATLGGGKVPSLYATYVKALSDFNFASLGDIDAAFDNNRVPFQPRSLMLNSSYYQKLRQDPTFNTFWAAERNPGIITGSDLPVLNNFQPQKAPWFPSSSNRVGFAYHPAAMALKSRLPQDFTQANGATIPGTVTTVTDPDTRISVLFVQRVDLVGNYAENRIEVMLGAAVGDRRAGMVLTSQ